MRSYQLSGNNVLRYKHQHSACRMIRPHTLHFRHIPYIVYPPRAARTALCRQCCNRHFYFPHDFFNLTSSNGLLNLSIRGASNTPRGYNSTNSKASRRACRTHTSLGAVSRKRRHPSLLSPFRTRSRPSPARSPWPKCLPCWPSGQSETLSTSSCIPRPLRTTPARKHTRKIGGEEDKKKEDKKNKGR